MTKKDELADKDNQADKDPDFIQRFIERKRLQNKILGDIIELINKTNQDEKSQTNQ